MQEQKLIASSDQNSADMDGLEKSLCDLRRTFNSMKTRRSEWRKSQLRGIHMLLEENEEKIYLALKEDLGKPKVEAFRDEVALLKKSVKFSLKSLDKWMARRPVGLPLILHPSRAEVISEPLGLILIFSSWNFPIGLSLEPMIGAIAAGNAVVLKPSELAPACSSLLANLIPLYLDGSAVKVVQGGQSVGQQLLDCKWDHIFFTGSSRVGRIVMTAAAKHLTPVSLELGGKCPAILDHFHSSRDRKVSIRRIVNAKWGFAGGQACLGVDYLLVREKDVQETIEMIKKRLRSSYGEDPRVTQSMTRVVNRPHFHRLRKLVEEPGVADSIVYGGQIDEDGLYIQPTILLNPPLNSNIMTEEIFGPFLPIITLNKIEDSVDFINSRSKPLAIYAFTKNEKFKDNLLTQTSSGSVTFNDAVVQFVVDGFPFGGVGESGIGKYHGKHSFDTFSNEKAVLRRNFLLDLSFGYPPWDDDKLELIRAAFSFDYLGFVLRFLGLKK